MVRKRDMNPHVREMYADFSREFYFCWACGWMRGLKHLLGFSRLENAHILGGPSRTADRRNLCRLCRFCHDLNTGATIRHEGEPLPRLETPHMLWLKRAWDPGSFDVPYLEDLHGWSLPAPEIPPPWFASIWPSA